MPVLESQLPAILGPSREVLKGLRVSQLVEGVDWYFKKRRVVWSDAAVEKIRGSLNLPPEKSAPGASAALPEAVTLLVLNARLVNTRIILAYAPGTDPELAENWVRVRVRSSANFMRFAKGKPMELKARHIQADLYELVGGCPKAKGRW